MNNTQPKQAPEQSATSDVARREEEVLAFWREHDIFKKSVEKDAPHGDFVFYDGPPFATGLPHYGHILAGTIKDAIPRFWTMNGYRVRRQWGWDCHGLPLENLIEKRLGLSTKRDIEEFGVKNFNEAARAAVMEYADDWRRIIPRMGRFADMDNDYKTMDPTYTESVWWAFAELNRKGLVYEGFKSMHLCPRCGTTLSNFEVNQGYKDIKDIAVTVKLPLVNDPATSLLVWTTTPWTLPGNMAAAVHRDGDYVKVRVATDDGHEVFILAQARLAQLGTEEYEVIETIKGSQLIGESYTPPFSYLKNQEIEGNEHAWKIYHADYVDLEGEGTGAVHLAPAYGEDDMELAKQEGVPIAHHVGEDGRFKEFVTDFAGQMVKPKDDDNAEITHLDADIEIVRALAATGALLRKENITHSYPHCWRCDTPLLNYATTSWFVRVTEIKDKLVSENEKVHWVPENVGTNRFGKWLEGARDWAVSRQRYWGAPLPVWRNPDTKEYKIFGSQEELQQHALSHNNQFVLMRHGESQSNVAGILNGAPDSDNTLTEHGCKQADAVAKKLEKSGVDYIYYSPLTRTKDTALCIAEALGLDQSRVIADDRILEMQFGQFEGQPADEYHTFFEDGEDRLTKVPKGGESWGDVKRRVGEFLFAINKKHADAKILVVSHNGTLEMLEAALHGDGFAKTADAIDAGTYDYQNGEIREHNFVPYPHNDNYELDFHRPYIDEYEVYDEDGTKLERVADVFDCWFESGSMPYAQHHYPFEHKKEFTEELFPADFIAESIDQTRGWFYSLIVLGVALFGKSPYKNVITNGLVLGEDGKKMSKKLQNYPDPVELVNRIGADSMRYYLLSSPIIKAEDLSFTEKDVLQEQRKNIGRLHNVLALYEQYRVEDTKTASSDSDNVILDEWINARVNELIKEVTEGFKNYELDRATRPISEFIDDLSVWYVRRSRERLKGDDVADKHAALRTLHYVLQSLALTMAPSMPFYAEYLWRQLRTKDDALSVHLATWPKAGEIKSEILEEMARIRQIVSDALEVRANQGIKVRQPLATLKIKHEIRPETEPFLGLVRDEVNVKEIKGDMSIDASVKLDTTITPELKAEGDARDFTRAIQDLRKQKGLSADDRITLTIQTSDSGEELVNNFKHIITRTVGADEVVFADAHGDEVIAGEHSFTVELSKR